MQRIVIIGATSAIAERCARRWVARGPVDATLVVRDAHAGERIAADLRVRGVDARIDVRTVDFVDPRAIGTLIDELATSAPIDIALVAHGSLAEQAGCEADLAVANDSLVVNGVSPALFAEALAGAMQLQGRGRLIVIGSVAGDRGRKSNYVYGAAKGMLDRYVQGLQHRLATSGVTVTIVKPGPTDTPMTAHLKAQGTKLADVDAVAETIVAGADSGRAVVYAPGKWWLIMTVIRHLPRFVFHRLNI